MVCNNVLQKYTVQTLNPNPIKKYNEIQRTLTIDHLKHSKKIYDTIMVL